MLIEQFFLIVVLTSNALASSSELPIAVDGSTNTQIQRSANNTPLVNIATPNSSGLSHNKFSDYNVNQIGLILNNAINNQNGVVLTQIGGLITDNVNLKNSGSASIILNEVTSNNISQINGFTEIAGSKADLILANPNGFVMNGAGFINTSKLTTVVGKANQFNADASNLTFKLSNGSQIIDNQGNGFLPKLVITGGGLDLESVDYSDLVANVMNIVAPIYGSLNAVNLRSGDASFDYHTKVVASDNATTLNNIPSEVAIDASNLGKIQAGKIFIIATQQGFGIKYSADLIAQRAGIVIDALGNIDYANISSTGNANQANIEITSKQGSITQNGVVQTKDLANNILINAFGEIKNYGKFLSSANVDIESKSQDFINYSLANLAKNNFTIKALNFSNLGEITASNDLEINAQTVSNSDKLIANANLIINADQINNNNSLYSQNNLTLNANETINNTSNSQIFALNDIAIKTNSINNSDGKIEAKNNLKLQNLTLADLKPTWVFNVKEQPITIENNKGNFYAKNLLEFALGKADYSIAGDLKSDGKIKISANNITNKINLQGNGDIEIIALDTFLNGALGVDNSGTAIIANNNLSITATNLLSNYATLSAKNNLHLTSLENNINNNLNAEIIAGSKTKIKSEDGKEKYLYQGLLTLDAKQGIVNQNSLNSIIVNGNYSLDVADFVNTGKVEVAGDLIFNITNDLTNDVEALILAGGNLEINVGNNLTNKTDAVIYSQGKLTIQKYALNNPLYNPDDNKINELTNSSGKIISYDGDMEIYAKTIENKRTIDPGIWLTKPNRSAETPYYYSWDDGQYDLIFSNHYLYNWRFVDDRCFGHKCQEYQARFIASAPLNPKSDPAKIFSGKTIKLDSDKINNIDSEILSASNLTINGDLVNSSKIYPELIYMQTSYRHHEYSDEAGDFTDGFSWFNLGDDKKFLGIIKAGGSFYGNSFAKIQNIIISPNYVKGNDTKFNKYVSNENNVQSQTEVDGSDQEKSMSQINSLNVSEIVDKGIINLDLSNYFSAQSVIGLFAKSSNPNRPLFETRSQFIDQSKFFGSDYFYQKIGLNLTNLQTQFEQQNQRLIGDQFFQNQIISEKLATLTKNSFLLSKNETNANNEIKSLLDNAEGEFSRLKLSVNKSLTTNQINSLQKDIIWYEAQNIDGVAYIVPKIYLSKATKDNLKNQSLATQSTIYAGGDLEINSSLGSLNNSGSIIANNIKITTKGDINNNNFSQIIATNDLALSSLAGSITNRSTLQANNNLNLVSEKNITNTSTVLTNDANLLNSGNIGYVANGLDSRNQSSISSKILETATISAHNITINAGHDINNVGATIKGGNLVYLTAVNDINNKALVNYTINGSSTNSDGSAITESQALASNARFISSNLVSQGNIESSGNLVMVAANDINIKGSNVNSTGGSYVEATNGNINVTTAELRDKTFAEGGRRKKHWVSITDNVSNIESNLTSSGTLDLVASGTTAVVSALPSEIGNINITGSKLTSADNLTLSAKNDVNITSAQDTTYSYSAGRAGKGKSYSRQSNSTTQVESELATTNNGDISITSGVGNTDITGSANAHGSIALIASKLTTKDADSDSSNNTGTGNITLAAKEDLTISSALNTKYSESHSSKKGLTVKKSSTEINSSSTNVSSELDASGDITTTSGNDTNIIASNLSGLGSGSINSGGNTNIFSATDTSYSYSESTKTRTGLIRQIPIVGQTISVLNKIFSVNLSTINGLTGGNLETIQRAHGIDYNKSNLANSSTTENMVASNLNFNNNLTIGSGTDLTLKASNLKTTSGDITLTADGDVNILSAAQTSISNRNYHDKSDRAKERGNTDTTEIKNISSTIISGSDLTIASGNDTTIQSSKLSSSDNLKIDAGNNLILSTAKDSAIKSDESKGGTVYTFTNGTSGYVDVKAVNNEITSNTNSATINSNLDLSANNVILAQYRAGTMEDVMSGANSNNQQLSYLKTVNDLAQADPNKVMLDPIADTMKHWDQTTRGLTGAGTAVVAVAAIAVTVVTMGSGATLGAAMMTAAAASGAATASVTATNASMNTDSSLLGSTKSIASKTWKSTTSEESIQNMAIAAVTAGAAFEASVYLSSTSSAAGAGSSAGSVAGSGSGAASSTGAATNTTTTVYVSPNLTSATAVTSNTASSSSFFTNLGNATIKIGTATTANIAATSAIKGQSIGEVIADQGGAGKVVLNTALQIVGEAGAMQIGSAAHFGQISQGKQLALHAALGCGIGAGMSGGGSGCAAGAAAGVIGELVGNSMYQEGRANPDGTPIGFSRNTSIAVAGLSGSLASAFTSIALGDDDSKVAKNVYAGNFVGTNAAANNSTLVDKNGKILDVDKEDGDRGVYIDNNDGGTSKDIFVGNSKRIDTFINPETGTIDENSIIKIGTSMDKFVENVSNIGGATVGGSDSLADLYYLAKDSSTGGPFDVKTKLGAFNGYLLNGEYVTGRDIGNYLAGVNGTKAGMPGFATIFASGTLQVIRDVKTGNLTTIPQLVTSPYHGEIPYSGKMILEGIRNTQNPPTSINAPLMSVPTSEYFNDLTNLFSNQTNYSLSK